MFYVIDKKIKKKKTDSQQVKSITGVTFVGIYPWLVYMICFTFLSVIAIFLTSLIFQTQRSFWFHGTPSLHGIGAQSHIWESWSSAYQKNIFGENITKLIKFLDSFRFCVSLITLYTYGTHSSLLLYFNFHVFSAVIAND